MDARTIPVDRRNRPGGAGQLGGRGLEPAAAPGGVEVPSGALPHRSSGELLAAARACLEQASREPDDGRRYSLAHLAALRAAAALLATRARVGTGRGRPTSVWVLLARVAPEVGEWATLFAVGSRKRMAVDAGLTGVVGSREADDLVRDAGRFVGLVTVLVATELGAA